jgi:hypothetical protein
MKNNKAPFVLIFLAVIAGCSSVEVHSVGNLTDSKALYKASNVSDVVPTELEKDKFYTALESNENFRKYLLSECLQLLRKEQGLNLERPVYASDPKWNNIENFYTSLFNFQSLDKNILTEQTMQCDLAINKNKEVTEYQLKKSYLQFHKAP